MNMKINIKCAKCHKRYSVEVPSTPESHIVSCPFCSEPYTFTVSAPSGQRGQKNIVGTGFAEIASKVRRYELLAGIAWIIIGAIQCILVYTAAAGAWNIVNGIMRIRSAQNIQAGNSFVVTYFDQRKIWLIVLAVVNLILGGVVAVLLVLFDWYVRDYVLQNRAAFESK